MGARLCLCILKCHVFKEKGAHCGGRLRISLKLTPSPSHRSTFLSRFVEASFEPWRAVGFRSSAQTGLGQAQRRPVMWKSQGGEPALTDWRRKASNTHLSRTCCALALWFAGN